MDKELPIDARQYLRHALATLAYRGGKALKGAPADFGSFKVGATSRTPSEILAHLCDLIDWAASLVRGQETWCVSTPGPWDSDVQRFYVALGTLDGLLAGTGSLGRPWTRLFQGPIADALTHVGQLTMLRRLAGSPVRGENYFKAEIVAGGVSPDQAVPVREFD